MEEVRSDTENLSMSVSLEVHHVLGNLVDEIEDSEFAVMLYDMREWAQTYLRSLVLGKINLDEIDESELISLVYSYMQILYLILQFDLFEDSDEYKKLKKRYERIANQYLQQIMDHYRS